MTKKTEISHLRLLLSVVASNPAPKKIFEALACNMIRTLKTKKPEVLGKSAGPKLRMNTARKDEFARAQEDQSTQKLTVLLNRQG
jgi:hypothetical protein